MYTQTLGNKNNNLRMIWLHGWNQNNLSFLKLSGFFNEEAENILIDLPGYGQSEAPKEVWGSAQYAKFLVEHIKKLPSKKNIFIGHSFGGKIALQIAVLFPEFVDGLVLIAASGLKRKRSIFFRAKAFALKFIAKLLKFIDYLLKTSFKEYYANRFGSTDYRNAKGILRKILVKSIHEDLSSVASTIKAKTLLIYGSNDSETPPIFGKRFNALIKNSIFIELPNFNHYDILSTGQHQIQNLITKSFLLEEKTCS